MNFSDGHWKGPILDNHFHLDKSGRYLDAALDFKRAGGTDLVLVHKPDFNNLPLNKFDSSGVSCRNNRLWVHLDR